MKTTLRIRLVSFISYVISHKINQIVELIQYIQDKFLTDEIQISQKRNKWNKWKIRKNKF